MFVLFQIRLGKNHLEMSVVSLRVWFLVVACMVGFRQRDPRPAAVCRSRGYLPMAAMSPALRRAFYRVEWFAEQHLGELKGRWTELSRSATDNAQRSFQRQRRAGNDSHVTAGRFATHRRFGQNADTTIRLDRSDQ